jgi:hypothetical protein
MLADSLLADRDFDVSNNLASASDSHGVKTATGETLIWHDPGTSLAILPGRWLAARHGAMFTINVAAALVAAGIFALAQQLGASSTASLVCAVLFAFAPPLVYYSSQIYPEVLGAACCVWACVAFLAYVRSPSANYIFAAGALLSVQPWLSIRFWVLVVSLGSVVALYLLQRRAAKHAAIAAAPLLLSLLVFAAFDMRHFGTWLPNAGYLSIRSSYPQFWVSPHVSMLGLWLDRGFGLLPLAPVYVFALGGLAKATRRSWQVAAVATPAVAYLGFLALSQNWAGGWCPPGRYILCSALLLAPFAAGPLGEKRLRPATFLLSGWTLFMSLAFSALPINRFPSSNPDTPGGILNYLGIRLGFPLSAAFPSLQREAPFDYWLVALWLAAVAAVVVWISRRREPVAWAVP